MKNENSWKEVLKDIAIGLLAGVMIIILAAAFCAVYASGDPRLQ